MVHLSSYYQHLLLFAMIFLGVTVGFCLLRAILGPRFTDRIVAVNIVGTKVIILIGAFAVYFDQDYLMDICLLYGMISFLAVVILSKTYVASYNRRRLDAKNAGRHEAAGEKRPAAEETPAAGQPEKEDQ